MYDKHVHFIFSTENYFMWERLKWYAYSHSPVPSLLPCTEVLVLYFTTFKWDFSLPAHCPEISARGHFLICIILHEVLHLARCPKKCIAS